MNLRLESSNLNWAAERLVGRPTGRSLKAEQQQEQREESREAFDKLGGICAVLSHLDNEVRHNDSCTLLTLHATCVYECAT